MRCPQCDSDNPDGMRFCGRCGSPLVQACPRCGSPSPAGFAFCGHCGASLAATTPAATAAPASPDANAERRPLTVLFCDLIGSTALSEQLDPEELRDIVRAYQQVCAEAIERYDGHIAQYLGDGILAYFGYPLAHEDDAFRAVRSALATITGMPSLNERIGGAERLSVRIGIHTGTVVVGDVGSGSRHEHLALGEVPNLAARLQGLAEPDQVVVSGDTEALIRGYFELRPLGSVELKGLSRHVEAFAVQRESDARGRLDATAGLSPLVGRQDELELLHRRWERAKAGAGTVAVISGEAGIGKSRLVRALRECIADDEHLRIELRCSPHHQASALYPVIDSIRRAIDPGATHSPEGRLAGLETAYRTDELPELVPLLAALLSLPHPARYPALAYTSERQRGRTMEQIIAWLEAQARRTPVLLIVEDLHWADPSSLELIGLAVRRVAANRILMLITTRPDLTMPWPAVPHVQLALDRFVNDETTALVTSIAGGRALPPQLLDQIVARTDGVPLFVEELTKLVLESGLLREQAGQFELAGALPPLGIPATLQASLMARLDRLGDAREVVHRCAVLGREFSYPLLRAVTPLDETALLRHLDRLLEAELLQVRGTPPTARFRFNHALVQQEAYQSLLRTTRRDYHRRAGEVLEEQFQDEIGIQPEVLAHHYTEGGEAAKAVRWWQRAGRMAVARSAHAEGQQHMQRALDVLATLPDEPRRAQQELGMQIALATSAMVVEGYASATSKNARERALELRHHLPDSPLIFEALVGLAGSYLHRSEYRIAQDLADQCLRLAEQADNPTFRVWAGMISGANNIFLGNFATARRVMEHALDFYDPDLHRPHPTSSLHDPGVALHCSMAHCLWSLGFPDQSLEHNRRAEHLARATGHPHSMVYILTGSVINRARCGDLTGARAVLEELIALADQHGFAFYTTLAAQEHGWLVALEGRPEEGIRLLEEGLATARAQGQMNVSQFLIHLVEACTAAGRPEDGLAHWAEARERIERVQEGFFASALYRAGGDLHRALPSPDLEEAERLYLRAIDVARQQEAKSLELVAAIALARLWRDLGRSRQAYDLLADVYQWFTEGYTTRDLREAKALLDELSTLTGVSGRRRERISPP